MYRYKKTVLFLICMAGILVSALTWAQTPSGQPVIAVSGEVTTPLTLKASDIRAMKQVEIKAKDNEGAMHTYSGVPLSTVLEQAGVTLGKQLRGENLAKFVLVKAADGYEVLFSLPEIDPEFTDRMILIADKQDGKPLSSGTGPYRIIVPGEKRHARWIREVASIHVLFAKE